MSPIHFCWIILVIVVFQGETCLSEPCDFGGGQMDTATVTLVPDIESDSSLALLAQNDACWQCSMQTTLALIPFDRNCSLPVGSNFKTSLEITEDGRTVWRYRHHYAEYGQYAIFLYRNRNSTLTVNFVVLELKGDYLMPIYVALGIFSACSVLWIAIRYAYRKKYMHRLQTKFAILMRHRVVENDLGNPDDTEPLLPSESPESVGPVKKRLVSLDAFRGLSLTIMIFVNYGGGGYWFFDHSFWNGLTVADLVFPWFTWILGTALAVSLPNQIRKGTSKQKLLVKIIRRACILFALGIILESSRGPEPLSSLRIPGVLQRLSFSYFVVAISFLASMKTEIRQYGTFSSIRDIIDHWIVWIAMLCLVGGHLGLTFLLPIRDVKGTCPTGYLGPGGLHDSGKYENCTGGAAAVIDRWLFGRNHIYQTPTCKEVYKTKEAHDPEGVLGTFTSIFLCFLGLHAGIIRNSFKEDRDKIGRWIAWSLVLGTIAGVLCDFKQNGGWIPVNKNLWSLSFVLSLGSMAFFLFAIFYITIDVHNIWTGAPFIYPGMNSIAIYACHMIFETYFPVSFVVSRSHTNLMALHLWGVSIWLVVAYIMYRKKIFISI